jgi:hypothetical protein
VLQEQPFGAIMLRLREASSEPPVAPNGQAENNATGRVGEPAGEQEQAESSRTIAEKIARHKAVKDSSAGVTWVEPADDPDSLDAGLQSIDQELRSIRIPPDPDLLLREPIPEPPAAPDAPAAPAAPAAPTAPNGEADSNASGRTEQSAGDQPPTDPAEPPRG